MAVAAEGCDSGAFAHRQFTAIGGCCHCCGRSSRHGLAAGSPLADHGDFTGPIRAEPVDAGGTPADHGGPQFGAVEEDEVLSVRRFRITVSGQTYDVEVEEISTTPAVAASPAAPPQPAVPAATPATPPAPAPPAAVTGSSPAATPTEGVPVVAPLPGVILEVRVKEGDKVQEGQVVVILEAMKMENEITAPVSGAVAAVNVQAGNTVDQGATLVVIRNA